jgi:hypothetical protein
LDTEWLLSTLFDASLLSLQKPPETAALFWLLALKLFALKHFLHAKRSASLENAVVRLAEQTGRWPAGCRMSVARGNHKKPCGWTLGCSRAMIYSSLTGANQAGSVISSVGR